MLGLCIYHLTGQSSLHLSENFLLILQGKKQTPSPIEVTPFAGASQLRV